MKIQTIDTFPLLYFIPKPYGDANGIKKYRSCYLIRITTEEGLEGWGECVDWLPTLHIGFTERIIPYLVGKSTVDRNQLVRTIKKWHSRAASAVSMALTEIAAKKAEVSVCELWGGRYREKVPVYASFQSYIENLDWKKHSINAIQNAISDGFDSIKLKIGGKPISEDQQHIGEVQAMLQGKTRLALDANQSYDLSTTMQWQSLLQSWSNILWMEEPLPFNHAAEYRLLRSLLAAPLAGGENIESAADYIPTLTQHALDFITPDPLHISGIDGYRDALRLIRSFGVRVTPHAYDGALSRLYAIFSQATLEPWGKMGTDIIEPVEWDVMDNPFTSLFQINPTSGEVAVPSGIGIGVELDTEKLAFYKWDGSSYT